MTGNATTQKMRSHTSCRAFLDKPVPAADVIELVLFAGDIHHSRDRSN